METAQNGWPASSDPTAIGIDQSFTAAGCTFPGGVKSGDVATVFTDLIETFDATVEHLTRGWCWGYDYRPIRGQTSQLSNHSAGCAVDLNAPLHPRGTAGTFSKAQITAIHALLTRYDNCISWGGDWIGVVDEMHFEVTGTPAELHALVLKRRLEHVASPIEEEKTMLSDEDVERVASAVVDKLTSEDLVAMLIVNPKTGAESREQVSITRALQSAQTQAARAAYRAG